MFVEMCYMVNRIFMGREIFKTIFFAFSKVGFGFQ